MDVLLPELNVKSTYRSCMYNFQNEYKFYNYGIYLTQHCYKFLNLIPLASLRTFGLHELRFMVRLRSCPMEFTENQTDKPCIFVVLCWNIFAIKNIYWSNQQCVTIISTMPYSITNSTDISLPSIPCTDSLSPQFTRPKGAILGTEEISGALSALICMSVRELPRAQSL
jgi:hypothetical protein